MRYSKSSQTALSTTLVFTGPKAAEGLTMVGTTELWLTGESGARYYQRRTTPAPLVDCYPFIIGIAP